MSKFPYGIFISYSQKDRGAAEKLQAAFEAHRPRFESGLWCKRSKSPSRSLRLSLEARIPDCHARGGGHPVAAMGAAPAKEASPEAAAEVHPAPEAQPAPAPHANGTPPGSAPAAANAAPAAEQAPRPLRADPVSTAFGDMVALLAKSPAHKHFSLADLEWLLLPPVALNQFALADAKLPNGQTVLAGFVLWARVAPDVDARLTQNQRYPVRLQPNEWRSGDSFWIIDAVGNPKVMQNIVGEVAKNAFGGKKFKMPKFQTGSAVSLQQARPA